MSRSKQAMQKPMFLGLPAAVRTSVAIPMITPVSSFYFGYYLPGWTDVRFLVFFLSALPLSALYSIIKYRDNPNYNAVGASGAVSAVVFASIFFDPYRFL